MIKLYGLQIYYFLSRNAKFCLSFVPGQTEQGRQERLSRHELGVIIWRHDSKGRVGVSL